MWPFKKKELSVDCGLRCPKSNACAKWITVTREIKNEKGELVQTVQQGKCAVVATPELILELISMVRTINK